MLQPSGKEVRQLREWQLMNGWLSMHFEFLLSCYAGLFILFNVGSILLLGIAYEGLNHDDEDADAPCKIWLQQQLIERLMLMVVGIGVGVFYWLIPQQPTLFAVAGMALVLIGQLLYIAHTIYTVLPRHAPRT